MAENTAIEWCDSTFNPWVGCTNISPACDHCYAESWAKRSGLVEWGNAPRRRTSDATWRQPMKWQRDAEAFFAQHGRRRRVFCASLADVFDNQVPDEWRRGPDGLWELISACPDLDWLLLTKRPQNIGKMLPPFWNEVKGRIWLGTTVEDQARADQNIPHLLRHDAGVRFISVEPMLGPIDLRWWVKDRDPSHRGAFIRRVDWVIAGGESGTHARPSHPDWFRSLRDQCAAAGVPFLFKQWGEWAPGESAKHPQTGTERVATFYDENWTNPGWSFGEVSRRDSEEMHIDDEPDLWRMGKRRAGRWLDGVEHNGFPRGSV